MINKGKEEHTRVGLSRLDGLTCVGTARAHDTHPTMPCKNGQARCGWETLQATPHNTNKGRHAIRNMRTVHKVRLTWATRFLSQECWMVLLEKTVTSCYFLGRAARADQVVCMHASHEKKRVLKLQFILWSEECSVPGQDRLVCGNRRVRSASAVTGPKYLQRGCTPRGWSWLYMVWV